MSEAAAEIRLPALVHRAATALANAASAAEVLDARDAARFAREDAGRTSRILRAKGAHGDLVAAAHRAKADAIEIEAMADKRLADEYDAAQERGEVKGHGNRSDLPDGNITPATVSDLGLSSKDIHQARLIRNAETLDPGIIRRTLDAQLAAGEEPMKAALRRAIADLKAADDYAKEVEKQPIPPPLTEEERAERIRIFGTPQSRAAFGDMRSITAMVEGFPDPEVVVMQVPPALEHSVDIEALREVARWFDAFCNAWLEREAARVAAQ